MKKTYTVFAVVLFLFFSQEVFAFRVLYVTTVAERLADITEVFYKTYSRYPESLDELVEKTPHKLGYSIKRYINMEFEIFYNKKELTITVKGTYTHWRNPTYELHAVCIYYIKDELYKLFQDDIFIRSYRIDY